MSNPISGCDSFVVLDLTVRKTDTIYLKPILCNGEKYTYKTNAPYTQTGIFSVKEKDTFGCDSYVIIDLKIKDLVKATITKSLCQGGQWLGHKVEGTYIDTLKTATGCDSILTSILKIVTKIKTTKDYCHDH